MTRVLVAWASKLGGSEGIAGIVADVFREHEIDVVLRPASAIRDLHGFDAAVIGSGLYASRWLISSRRLVTRNLARLRQMPIWFFSSGPLDDSADRAEIAPAREVAILMERSGALGHATFGGRLPADAKGFPAEAMAKKHAGDWRNTERIRTWAETVVRALPAAAPGKAVDPPARSLWRLLAYGVAGWGLCAILMAGLLAIASQGVAITLHAIAAPFIFAALAWGYFAARGAREPLGVAVAFTAIVAVLDAVVVAALFLHSFAMFTNIVGTWLPFFLIFAATWATGSVMAMLPRRGGPKAAKRSP